MDNGITIEATPTEAITLATKLSAASWINTWAAIAGGTPAGPVAVAIAGLGISTAGLHDLAELAAAAGPCPCGNH